MTFVQETRHELFFRVLGDLPGVRRTGAAMEAPPLSGFVTIAGHLPDALAGHAIEICSEFEPELRAQGLIGRDGSFRLMPLGDEDIPPGRYRARLILRPDGRGRTRDFGIPWRYLVYSTSGWTVDLPTESELEFMVTV